MTLILPNVRHLVAVVEEPAEALAAECLAPTHRDPRGVLSADDVVPAPWRTKRSL